MRLFLCVVSLFFMNALQANPWGKDADLVQDSFQQDQTVSKKSFNPVQLFAKKVIRFHQKVLSPADGPRSHFYPSSSHYALQAIQKYGFYKGYFMGCDRLMRENDDLWVYRVYCLPDGSSIKYDPVPPNF